jgi:hypothetical protein
MHTESFLDAPVMRKIPVDERRGVAKPRMSNVTDVSDGSFGATDTLYNVLKLFTGTMVVVDPALLVTTVTHIWFPLRNSVAVRPF